MLDIALLGPLVVCRDGVPVRVPRGRASEVLLRLALEPGSLVSADRLVEDLWGEAGAETRPNTLQAKVTMLRRAIGPSALDSRDGGYALMVEPTQVDAFTALRQTTSAVRLREAGDAHRAAEVSAGALDLFRGEVLQTAGDAEWTTVHRSRLEEARLTLLEVHFWAKLRLGEFGAAIGELEAAVGAHPFRESLWELLITALYQAGRQADALAAYQRVRHGLADELGIDPGPELRRLERQVLAQELPIHRGSDSAGTSGNLPALAVELVGREADLAAVAELVEAHRLVEVVGLGGVGKTALALAAGRLLLDSDVLSLDAIWLARLESAVTAEDVVDALVAAVDVPAGAALMERLASGSALVILDNCEHLVDALAQLVERLLNAGPGLRLLCTSQVALGVAGEHVVELAPLGIDDAATLFSARAVERSAAGQTDPESVRELCRELEGLPLAIELAAARTRTLSVEDISRRLDDRLSLLTDPTSRQPDRRRSLRSTIRWSYELLFPDDQRGLWALATFAGGATLPAAGWVLAALDVPTGAALDVIDRLASRSFVIVEDVLGETRYRLLDSIRAFASEAMAEANYSARGHAAHAQWYAAAAATSTSGVRNADQAGHLDFARVERANIDAALAWSGGHDPSLALDIATGFGWAWVVLGDSRGASRLLSALDAATASAPVSQRVSALLLAGWIEASSGDLEPAMAHVRMARDLAEATGDTELRARSCYYLAYVVSHHGDWAHALELTERSARLFDALDRPWDQAANALFAARAAISAGDLERSDRAVARAQACLRSTSDPWLRVRGDAVLGELARVHGRFDDAVVYLATAAETSRRLGFRQTEAYQLASLGRAQCQTGDYRTGTETLRSAKDKAEATGDVRLAALIRVHLGRVLRAEGYRAHARAALEAAAAWHRSAGGGEQALLGDCLLAALDAQDRIPGAQERLAEVLASARADGVAHVEVFALDALARGAASVGGWAQAEELLGAADARLPDATHFITEHDRVDAHWVRREQAVTSSAR